MSRMLEHKQIRHRVDPGDVPPEKAARRLHLTLEQFREKLPALLERKFPPPDPDTGNFDLDAIDLWRKRRNASLYGLTPLDPAEQPKVAPLSMGDRFAKAKIGERHGRAS